MGNSSTLMQDKDLAQLATVVGAQHLRHEEGLVIVAPADAQQIAEILRIASAQHAVVTPIGGGTKQQWGNPVSADIHLDLTRMHSIREHAWQDMTCTIEAGARWADVQAELRKQGQMVALDPLWPKRATVGGIIACNDSGAMRLKYGGLRDLIVGMTVVLADGTIAKSGGKVVKNVAGYDLHKLMTGSFGTLAVIAEVNFRLHPIELQARTWSFLSSSSRNDARGFAGALRKILDAPITPTSVQLRSNKNECALDIRVASLPTHLEECDARLKIFVGEMRVVDATDVVWQARERLFENVANIVLKISVPPIEICTLSQELQETPDPELAIESVAQANGLVTIAVEGEGKTVIALIHRLRERVRPLGGSVVVQQLPDAMREHVDIWGPTSNPLPLMREVKRRFDPDRVLNRGRFVGNI